MKLKTHRGAAKRFKVTGTGKITRHHAFARHILTKKSAGRKRKLGQSALVSDADNPSKMLPTRIRKIFKCTVPRAKRGTKRHNRRTKILGLRVLLNKSKLYKFAKSR
jgi:large subunit ribosomal protein L35